MIMKEVVINLNMFSMGKNAHTPPKLSTTGQKTPLTFLLANLLLKLFKTAKSILQLVSR